MDVMAMEQTLLSHYGREDSIPPPEKPGYLALSRTTDRVLQILLGGDLARLRADSVAESLGMSSTTLRRRLRADDGQDRVRSQPLAGMVRRSGSERHSGARRFRATITSLHGTARV